MIALSRLKRAIDDASQTTGMRTGSPKVILQYADAHRLYKELEHLQSRLDTELDEHIAERQRLLSEIANLKAASSQTTDHDVVVIEYPDTTESEINTDRAIMENNGVWSETGMYGSGYFVRDNRLYLSCIDVPRAVFICSKAYFHHRLRQILDTYFMGDE